MSWKKFQFVIFIFVIIFTGCIKDNLDFDKVADTSWEPDLAAPLVNSNLTFEDIVGVADSGTFIADSNHFVTLVYRTNLYTIHAPDLITIPYQEDNQSFQLNSTDSSNINNSNVDTTISNILQLNIPSGGLISSVVFQSAILKVKINSLIPLSGVLNVSIPSITNMGVPFSRDINVDYTGIVPIIVNTTFDISGYSLTPDSGNNQLGIFYTATFFQNSPTQPITNLDYSITTGIDLITPLIIYGNPGSHHLAVEEDTSQIIFFKNFQNGSIFFSDPKLTFYFYNSIGVPISLDINSIIAYNDNGNSAALSGYQPNIQLQSPSQPGQTTEYKYELTTPGTNLDALFGINPNYIVYSIDANANPTPSGFVSDSSTFRTDIELSLPLKGYATGFTIQDTTDFRLEQIENVQSAVFRINLLNGFPASALNQIYFTDENYNILESMFIDSLDGFSESAQIDNNGKVIVPSHMTVEATFTGDRLSHLFNCKKLLISSLIQTTDAQNHQIVEIYDNYKINVKIGVRTKLKIKF